MYFAYYFHTQKLRFSSPSCPSVPRVLLSYSKVAIFQPELQRFTPRTRFKSCDFPARAAKVYSAYAYYFRTPKLRFSSRSCESVPRILLSYSQVAILQPKRESVLRALRFFSQSCEGLLRVRVLLSYSKVAIFKPEQLRTTGGHRTRDRGIAKAGAQATRQLPEAASRAARALRHARSPQRARRIRGGHSEGAWTRTIHARSADHKVIKSPPFEGRSGILKSSKCPQVFNIDHADPRRRPIRDRSCLTSTTAIHAQGSLSQSTSWRRPAAIKQKCNLYVSHFTFLVSFTCEFT